MPDRVERVERAQRNLARDLVRGHLNFIGGRSRNRSPMKRMRILSVQLDR